MAIHERLYARLANPPRERAGLPALAISRYGARYATKGVFAKVVLFGAYAPAIFFLFAIWGISRNEQNIVDFMSQMAGRKYDSFEDIEPDVIHDVVASMVWLMVFIQSWFSTVLTALVGSHQIADDMRSHAFEVYLARPINRWDYLLGKILVIMRPLCQAMLLPILVILAVAHALIPATFGPSWSLYPEVIATILIWAFVNATVMLGISSTGKSARYASVIWFVLTIGTFWISAILQFETQNSAFELVSYNHNLFALVFSFIGLEHSLVELEAVTVDPNQSRLPNLAILAALSALGIWLVLRRLRSGRLP